jgi:hypothetical protein
VALLCDYFAAPSDEAAAVTIDWPGGPAQPPPGSGAFQAVVQLAGIEPVVILGRLEGQLTGRAFTDILQDSGHGPVAIRDGGERLVIPIGSRLEIALSELEPERLIHVASTWATIEEFGGNADPAFLVDVLSRLRSLSDQALETAQHVYCWMCV